MVNRGLALFEYLRPVPATRLMFGGNGEPFGLFPLEIMQEVITLIQNR